MLHKIEAGFNRREIQVIALFVICLSSFFAHLGEVPADLMEARNFVTAREIVQNNSWLLPTLNGQLRIAKPPLPTWITAASYILGGFEDSNAILRIPAALMAMILVFSLGGLVRCLSGSHTLAFICAAVAATTLMIMNMGRCGSWDIYCHSFMLLSIWALVSGWRSKSQSYLKFSAAGILMGCSFMSKGPVAFYTLLLPFVIAYAVSGGYADIVQHIRPLIMTAALGLFLGGLWPAVVFFKLPQISSTIAGTEAASWVVRHRRPIFFYAQFPIYSGLWFFWATTALLFPFARKRVRRVGNYRFMILWLLIAILLLSIIPEKKERYLLPALIPLAVLTGHLCYALILAEKTQTLTIKDQRLLIAHFLSILAASMTAPMILFVFGYSRELVTLPTVLIWSGVFLLLAGMSIGMIRKKSVLGILGTGVMLSVMVSWGLLPSIYQMLRMSYPPGLQTLRETRRIAEIQPLPFYATYELNPKQIWDLGKIVRFWNFKADPNPIQGGPMAVFSPRPISNIPAPNKRVRYRVTPIGKFAGTPKDPTNYVYLSIVDIYFFNQRFPAN